MKFIFIVIFTFAFSIVNAQKTEKNSWKYKINSGCTFFSGNVSNFSTNNNFSISHLDSVYEFVISGSAIYGKNEHIVNKQDYNFKIKYDLYPFSIISFFTALETYNNKQKGLKYRISGLSGIKLLCINNKNFQSSLSSAIQLDNEYFYNSAIENEISKNNSKILRLSFRTKIKQKITKIISIENTTFFQPSIKNIENYRIYSFSSINFKLYDFLYLNLEYIYEYDNFTIYSNIKKEDNSLFLTFNFNF